MEIGKTGFCDKNRKTEQDNDTVTISAAYI